MFSKKILIIISLMLGFGLRSASAEGIAGFDQLHWKMTKEQIERTYPNFQEWTEETFATDPLTLQETSKKIIINRYGLREYYILGCRMVFYIDFIDNELESLSFRHMTDANDNCADRLKEGLKNKYGQPTNPSINNSRLEMIEWKKNDTKVNLTIYINRYSSGGDIFLHYSNAGILEKWLLKQVDKNKL